MLAHLFASAGPLTSLLGDLATAIGSGFVIGGFAGGTPQWCARAICAGNGEESSYGQLWRRRLCLGGADGRSFGEAFCLRKWKNKIKHANKGIVVGAILIFGGAILFHSNETALSIVGFAACRP